MRLPHRLLLRSPSGSPARSRWSRRIKSNFWRGLALTALLGLLLQALWPHLFTTQQRKLTQKDIDAAVLRTLETTVLPSQITRAVATVAPSVVRVAGYTTNRKGEEEEHGVGTGVVIVNTGIILTNLHVVAGAQRIEVTFF
ncbi:hypothetical protein ACQV5M_19905, partial [Leptospira sp. SA-E8]|uniref:hypothetical protein n=1 Tax=Leptospira sp. SA-E8 TaxID=3422259 RepID=UPI003EB9A807